MVDESQSRLGRFWSRVDALDRTFNAAGIDPGDAESREKFGEEQRRMRDLLASKDRRKKWLGAAAATIVTGVATAAILSLGPALVRIIVQLGK